MNITKLLFRLATLLSIVFTAEVRAQLPNAWQINDNLTTAGIIEYVTNLTTGQVSSANTNGWHYELVSRMVSDNGAAAAHSMAFGNGTRRFYIFFDLDGSGRLTAQLLGNTTYTLTTTAEGTNYHVHELQYDPATSNATYRVDGVLIASWPGQVSTGQSNQIMWGANSSTGEGVMNYHSAKFEILGQGGLAAYGAGFDGNPAVAPSPTNQGWTRFVSSGAIPEGPVSPDAVAVPTRVPAIETLAASPVAGMSATVNALLDSGGGLTSYYFEYGATTNYSAFTPTNTVSASDASTNVTGTIGGLSVLTTYHFRAVAFNSVGMVFGQDEVFTTTRLLPNAWQINDDTAGPSLLQYQTNLTAAQVSAADSGGWHYEVVSRMVSSGSNPSQSMAFGDGTRRFYLYFKLDGSGQLTAQLLGGTTYTLTDSTDGTNYHTHELTSDPVTGNATYMMDGVIIASWPGQTSTGQSNQVIWGANSSGGIGAMDYHSAEFDINGEGMIVRYEAGFQNDPEVAPSPTNQGWTLFTSGTLLPEGPVSPDGVALAPLQTSPASDITPVTAVLRARLHPDTLDTACWFEYGTTTNYGNFSLTNMVPAGVTETNLSIGISGLTPATTYHFRAAATNATGLLTGGDLSFTTPVYVTTLPATGVTPHDATLNASLNPGPLGLTYYWEYGQTTNYGSFTSTNTVPAGLTATNVMATISGLTPGTTYHFRAIATDGTVTANGGDLSLSTPQYYTVGGGVGYSSAAWGDYDNDGRMDILLTGYDTNGMLVSEIWRNTGHGFTNINAGLTGVYSGSVAWGDYDGDGRLDILLTGDSGGGNFISQIWRNTGSGFSNVTASVAPGLPGVEYSSVAWGDYDNDGRLDFLLTGFHIDGTNVYSVTQLWRNTGNGFSDVTARVAPGLTGVEHGSVAWGDYDNDGRLDFLITGYNGDIYVGQLWRNLGGEFSNVTASVAPGLPGVEYGSVAWGDYDNDGRLDFLITGYNGNTVSQLWRNTGSGFSNVTASVAPGLPGIQEGSVAWGDYDNDGLRDILLEGYNYQSALYISQVWRNTGTGFTNLNLSLPGIVDGSAAFGDADNDGRLDLLLAGNDVSTSHSQVWVSSVTATNTPPSPPSNLVVVTNFPRVLVQWNAATDAETAAGGLTYNLRVGTAPGASDVVNPQSDASGLRRVPAMGNAQTGTNAVLSLTAGTYYWSVQAVDAAFAGSAFAPEGSFSVPTLPIGDTLSATQVRVKSAILNGQVNPNTLTTEYHFEYGLTTNYGGFTATNLLAAGVSTLNVSALIDGLNVATTYHFRIVVENAAGVTSGEDRSFTTPHAVTDGLPGFGDGVPCWGDYDRDGRLDVAAVGWTNLLFPSVGIWRNTGVGFNAAGLGIQARLGEAVAWVDYDNDGDLDLQETVSLPDYVVKFWRNDGGTFTGIATNFTLVGVERSAVAWGDYDNDGRQDFLYSSYYPRFAVLIARNLGNTFSNIDIGLNIVSADSVAWGDFDGDGHLDFILTGTTNLSATNGVTGIWRNNGDNTFSNVTAILAPGLPQVIRGSVAWGDYDADGRLDLLVAGTTNNAGSGAIAQVWHNTGAGFTNVNAGLPGVYYGTAAWGDYDSDGRPDVLLTGTTNGAASGAIAQIWRNTGTGFTNLNAGLPGIYNSQPGGPAAFGDYDNDGRLDVLLVGTTVNGDPLCEVWINDEPETNTVPTAPAGLNAVLTGGGMQLHWNPAIDAQTSSNGLSYNVRIGTTPGGSEVVGPEANSDGWRLLPALGNAQMRTNAFLVGLNPGTYYWSVQAVDTSFAGGPFAPEATFVMPEPTLSIARTNTNVTLSWQPSYSGVVLQESSSLNPAAWTNSPSGATNPIVVPATNETMFYRLFKP